MVLTGTSIWRLVQSLSAYAYFITLTAGLSLCSGSVQAQSSPAVKLADASLAGIPSLAAATPVEGFRQARFGMSELEVRQALRRDFPAAAERPLRFTHPGERTTVLAVTAADLLPDTGPAQLFYILGYASKRLAQVNIVWSSDGRSAARDEAIVAAANTLRDHFKLQYPAPLNAVVANQPAGKNAFLVFRASQTDGRMVLLLLSGVAAAGRVGRTLTTPPLTLQLSYIRDYKNSDTFRIERGRF